MGNTATPSNSWLLHGLHTRQAVLRRTWLPLHQPSSPKQKRRVLLLCNLPLNRPPSKLLSRPLGRKQWLILLSCQRRPHGRYGRSDRYSLGSTAATEAHAVAVRQLAAAQDAASSSGRTMSAVMGALGGTVGITVAAIAGLVMWYRSAAGAADDAVASAMRYKRKRWMPGLMASG